MRQLSSTFTALAKAGIIESIVGGKNRGFIFAKDPKEVTICDIIDALEGEESVKCCGDLIKCKLRRCAECSIYADLKSVIEKRREILSAKTMYCHYKEMDIILGDINYTKLNTR